MQNKSTLKRKFYDSLKRGTGEAYLIAKANPNVDFSNYIIKGALTNYAYDGQAENSRAQYIFNLISLSGKKEKIRKAVLRGLATEREDTWSLTHLFDLVKIYAQHGDEEARKILYDNFLQNPIEGSDWVGSFEILELDGLKGLFFIAEKYGKWLEQNPEDWQDDHLINLFQENNPQLKVKEELQKAAKSNRFIKVYLDNIKKTKANYAKQKHVSGTYSDIVDEVLNSKPFLSFWRKRNLTEADIVEIAERLIVEKDKEKQEKLLEVFDSHRFPLDSEFVLQLAKQKPTSKNRIREYAIDALTYLKSESIRQFALDKIPKSNRPQQYINILYSNYKEGDAKLLMEVATKFKSEQMMENLAVSYIDIFEANPTQECREPLEVLYSKMTCGLHRNSLVKILIGNNVLSERIKNEIPYDSDLETRELLGE
ncbi:hypothetical protein [Rufibacter roseus]|uniref:HEAT repeat domain-containing protein n=1 Tax=Rufibacter roseus TaxID=1567108 RepID=A0ABW2DMY2_9BACT|nr:hypothetical protein [Rufibacter roseus]